MKKTIFIIAILLSINCNGYYQGCARIDMSEAQVLQNCGEPTYFSSARRNGNIITIYSYSKPSLLLYNVEIENDKVKNVTIW